MSVTCPCDACGRWLPPEIIDICADCERLFCADCIAPTHHRIVHEGPLPDEADIRAQGWTYLRCADTPYSVYEEAGR